MFSIRKNIDNSNVSGGLDHDEDKPIVIADVGCRWGFAERFLGEDCKKSFRIFGFDPDETECARLQESYKGFPDGYITCVPVGLAGSPGSRNLYLTKEPACSSLHPPSQMLSEGYPALDCIGLERIVSVNVTTLDVWASENHVSAIDYIKVDTQGTELEILKGGENIINTTRFIDIEVEFNPIYEGQTLFGETDVYLRSKGFVLWRLSNLIHYSLGGKPLPVPGGTSVVFDTNTRYEVEGIGGQLFWADARYIHKDVLVGRRRDSTRFLRDSALFSALGMVDIIDHMNRVAS